MSDINEIIKALESELPGRGLHSQLPRKTRRAMERVLTKYMDKVQVEGEDDKRYFIENPSRNHRVRLAFHYEEQQLREIADLNPCWMSPPPNRKIVIAVKQLMPGVRMKKPGIFLNRVQVCSEHLLLFGEEDAQEFYDRWKPDFEGFCST